MMDRDDKRSINEALWMLKEARFRIDGIGYDGSHDTKRKALERIDDAITVVDNLLNIG